MWLKPSGGLLFCPPTKVDGNTFLLFYFKLNVCVLLFEVG